jgi:sugar/nucleoside kinase (ribokinase family)
VLAYQRIEPVDYLVIGHLTRDVTPKGVALGGTAAYSGLTALASGLRVGIVTACAEDEQFPELEGISVAALRGENTTTFQNIDTPKGRVQLILHRAHQLEASCIPETWRTALIVHLGPVAQEIDPDVVRVFPRSLICLTPQGWLRAWDKNGNVYPTEWPEAQFVLEKAAIAVISLEDIDGDESRIEEMLESVRILAVTEGANGARVYWNGDLRRFLPPSVKEVDATGAGDIFAAAFFSRYQFTHNPWQAGRYATQISAVSVTRSGLTGIPTAEEIETSIMEVIR